MTCQPPEAVNGSKFGSECGGDFITQKSEER